MKQLLVSSRTLALAIALGVLLLGGARTAPSHGVLSASLSGGTSSTTTTATTPWPPRGCMAGSASAVHKCSAADMEGINLWLAKPPVLVKRGTLMTFRGRVIDRHVFDYDLLIRKGDISGQGVGGFTSRVSRGKTVHMTASWKAVPGRYTVVSTVYSQSGTYAIIYASWAFTVR